MPSDVPIVRRGVGKLLAAAAAAAALACGVQAWAQQFGQTYSFPGGVSINADGMLTNTSVDDLGKLRQARAALLKPAPGRLHEKVPMRKVSLRRLDAAVRQTLQGGATLPDEMQYLAGLQRIEYLLVDPQQQDLVLVGPGEGWRVGEKGIVVGESTGRPVMLLDDLAVALRAANDPARRAFTCSIDPTPEGLQRLRVHAQKLGTIGDPQSTARGIEETLGPQTITVSGVPPTSHFAQVMVAADYRMKRVSMNLEPAPVTGLPSFIHLMSAGGKGMQNMLPRWWLAPNYDPLLRDEDGLTWQLRGAAVKAFAENDFLDASGQKRHTGKADPVSQRWADLMTARYDELALADPIFGQLRNCMDLAIVAALIVRHDLCAKAQASLPMLMETSGMEVSKQPVPKQVASQAALAHKGRKWIIAAGGVEINPWAIVDRSEVNASVGAVRAKIRLADDGQWWSN